MRKVEPMAAALRSLDAACWIAALRRDQSHTRRDVAIVEHHRMDDGRTVVKVHPLANWTRQDVWGYIREHDLPYHPLLDQGYTSIGCYPCTVAATSRTSAAAAGLGRTRPSAGSTRLRRRRPAEAPSAKDERDDR